MSDDPEPGTLPGDAGHPDEHLADLAAGSDDPALADARRHVEGCARCAEIVEDERAVRAALSGLPPVEPPTGYFSGLVRRRHRQALAVCVAGLACAVAVWALVVGGESGVVGEVQPEVEQLRARHMEVTDEASDFVVMADEEDMPAPYRQPTVLAGRFERQDRYHRDDGTVQVTYSDGVVALSLFEQAGRLDPDDLPGDMEPMAVGDGGWELAGPPVRVVIARRGDLVYTLVGTAAIETMRDAVDDLPPERPMSLDRRVTAALDDLFTDFGLGF